MQYIRLVRSKMKPEARLAIDGFCLFFGMTLFFCLAQSAYDGIAKRNTAFDQGRWWYPIYRAFNH